MGRVVERFASHGTWHLAHINVLGYSNTILLCAVCSAPQIRCVDTAVGHASGSGFGVEWNYCGVPKG